LILPQGTSQFHPDYNPDLLMEIIALQVERCIDKKLDKAERLLKQGKARTRRWYHTLIGEDDFQLKEIHFFLVSFAAGVAIGIASAN